MKRRFLSLPVFVVLLLIVFVYYSTVFVFIEEWLSLKSSHGLLNSLIFTFFAAMILSSYATAILRDPGRVPYGLVPDIEGSNDNINGPKETGAHKRYCEKCCHHKPPRAHHCRVCRRCVLRMDHHCIWINNCVGHGNYRPFLVSVLYSGIASTYSMVIFLCNTLQKYDQFSTLAYNVFYVFCGAIIVSLCLVLDSLLGWQIYLLCRNMTTIEYRAGVRAKWLAKKAGQNYHHPYDLGVCKNLNSVLGQNMLMWVCPISSGHRSDGIHFPTSRD
ncbi:hypothetical protein AMTR_s00009p00051780 [Amborella trichopoda]|uniref:S-acyltransferase n=2 Tax=Amborella trichopoda TaxID=13333 RepID=W1NGA6_AMBTC|nr:hypothetical protein AMTR_s00009p00051780 [Amborella trichopoda]